MKRLSFSNRLWNISFLIVLLSLTNNIRTQAIIEEYPIIDGVIEPNEWSNGDKRTITMVDGTLMETNVNFS
ncbi:MAG: hypothetical protein ACXAC2_24930 [Candidatus Kariarchaeaceae archaeon]|jgi:hypothetical protein